jgi:hypothetical protein
MVINTVVVGVVFCVAILVVSGQVRRAIDAVNETLVSLWRIREELQGIRNTQEKIVQSLEKNFWTREIATELQGIKKLIAKDHEV